MENNEERCVYCDKPQSAIIFGGTRTVWGELICWGWCETALDVDSEE